MDVGGLNALVGELSIHVHWSDGVVLMHVNVLDCNLFLEGVGYVNYFIIVFPFSAMCSQLCTLAIITCT